VRPIEFARRVQTRREVRLLFILDVNYEKMREVENLPQERLLKIYTRHTLIPAEEGIDGNFEPRTWSWRQSYIYESASRRCW